MENEERTIPRTITDALLDGISAPSDHIFAWSEDGAVAVISAPPGTTELKYLVVDLVALDNKRVLLALPTSVYLWHRDLLDVLVSAFGLSAENGNRRVRGGGLVKVEDGMVTCFGFSGDYGMGPHHLAARLFTKALQNR